MKSRTPTKYKSVCQPDGRFAVRIETPRDEKGRMRSFNPETDVLKHNIIDEHNARLLASMTNWLAEYRATQ